MIEYISKYEMELRIENALDNAKAVEMNEYRYGVVKGLEIAKDIIEDIKIRSTFRGQWLEEKYLIGSQTWEARCSCCHCLEESSTVISENYNWCPNCGADMRDNKTIEE